LGRGESHPCRGIIKGDGVPLYPTPGREATTSNAGEAPPFGRGGSLWAFVTLWGNNEEPAACLPVELSPNATGEIDFGNYDGGYLRAVSTGFGYGYQVVEVSSGLNLTFGAVKVLVTNLRGRPTIGVVGYLKQAHVVTNDVYGFDIKFLFATESRLQPVPPEVLLQEFTTSDEGHTIKWSELRKIRDLCQPTVPIPG
jgi:hypothetical protein